MKNLTTGTERAPMKSPYREHTDCTVNHNRNHMPPTTTRQQQPRVTTQHANIKPRTHARIKTCGLIEAYVRTPPNMLELFFNFPCYTLKRSLFWVSLEPSLYMALYSFSAFAKKTSRADANLWDDFAKRHNKARRQHSPHGTCQRDVYED